MDVTAIRSTLRRSAFIDNDFLAQRGEESVDAIDPATGERIVAVATAGQVEVDEAVRAAERAMHGGWSDMLPRDRERVLRRLAEGLSDRRDEFAKLESLDTGKPLALAERDVDLSVEYLDYFSGWPSKSEGRVINPGGGGFLTYVRPEPVGVVGAIVPWNSPLRVAIWKLAPALAAGCTVILKPAEEAPLSCILFGELVAAAGLPPGVVGIVPGPGEVTGAALASHPHVDKISFTGSREVGGLILRASADTNLKRVDLELGGKNANIIFADADLTAAIPAAVRGAFFNSGQVCTAGDSWSRRVLRIK